MDDMQPYKLDRMDKVKRVASWQECRDMCRDNTQCEYFKYKVRAGDWSFHFT